MPIFSGNLQMAYKTGGQRTCNQSESNAAKVNEGTKCVNDINDYISFDQKQSVIRKSSNEAIHIIRFHRVKQ